MYQEKISVNTWINYIKLICVIFAWGGVYHTAHYMVQFMEPVPLGLLRYTCAFFLLLCLMKKQTGSFLNYHYFEKHWGILIFVGVFGIGLYNLFFLTAESDISGDLVSIIFALTPCVTIILSRILFRTKLTMMGLLGIIIALCGTIGLVSYNYILAGNIDFLESTHMWHGELYTFYTVLCASIYNLTSKQASKRGIPSIVITTYAALFGSITLLICELIHRVFVIHPHAIINISLLPLNFWWAFLYTVVIGSVLGYLWFSQVIDELGVSPSAIAINGIPLASVVIGLIILGTFIPIHTIIFGSIIILGVIVTSLSLNPHKVTKI